MTKQTTPNIGLRIDSVRSSRRSQTGGAKRRSDGNGCTAAERHPIRIARGNQVIGDWSSAEVNERLKNEDLLVTDSFYDEESSDWLPLSELKARQTTVTATKVVMRPCYCGTGLPFRVCCGDRTNC